MPRPLAFWLAIALLIASATISLLHRHYARRTALAATLTNAHLFLTLTSPTETLADLFLIREPGHDVYLHLHPTLTASTHFDVPLPAMPGGTYVLFAELHSASGTPETTSLRLSLPQKSHAGPAVPDAAAVAVLPPIQWTSNRTLDLHNPGAPHPFSTGVDEATTILTATLPSGYTLYLLTPANLAPLHANLFQLVLLAPSGTPPTDMALYLGMNADAVILRDDDQVFAHIHPAVPPSITPSNLATIPYTFPSPGKHRLFIQMKHGALLETGVFDLTVR